MNISFSMNDIIKLLNLLEDLGVLVNGVTETVKHETKKQEGEFLGPVLALFFTQYWDY